MKIKQFIISAYLLLCGLPMMAQQPSNCPASPYPITIKQADGTSITIIGKGNLLNSWTETVDGYTVVEKNGMYEYARKVDGKLVATGVKARNSEERKPEEKTFLQKTPKSLKPDAPSQSNTSLLNPSNSPLLSGQNAGYPRSGNIKTLLILIKYPDMPNTYGNAYFNNMMNATNYRGTGSFRDFFIKSSVYSLTVDTDVVGWYTAKNSYEYYGKKNGDLRSVDLVREAVDAANKAGVDFSKYDNDKDGKVDGIIVAHAGPGAEEGNQLQYIWSHRWWLSANSKQVSYDGVLVEDYMINPETRIFTNDIVGIGVYCHEFGHNLGLPDLYDTDEKNGSSEGIGEWCLMGSAGWLGKEHQPGNMSAWARTTLGWMSPTTITTPGNYSLYFGAIGYRMNTPVPNEYFLIENRQKLNLDVALNGSGLAIWHINTDKTSMYPPTNYVNADENLKGVDLEEADGRNDLDYQLNRGDAGDLFAGPSNKTAFNDNTYPNSKTYTGVSSGVNIHDISIYDNGTTSRYKALFTVGNALSSGGYDFPLSYPYGCNNSDYINHFGLNTLVNSNSGCNGLANNYINHAPTGTKTTQLLAGKTYGISMQSGPNPQGFGVWIDFNDNKTFDDPGEFVYHSGTASTGGFISSITIPDNFLGNGLKRMRVRSVYNYVPTALDADKALGRPGETEDYTISIGHCTPFYAAPCTSGDYIDDFSFNTLDHQNSGCNGQPNNYINLNPLYVLTTAVVKGQTYPISMQSGPSAQGFGVWIDYNDDQDFNDSGEFVYASPTYGTGIFKGTVTIPATITAGYKRVRIRSKFGAVVTSGQACEQFALGETQDYTITVANPVVATSQWNKRFGGSGADNFSVVIKTSDGGYLLGGHSTSAISGDRTQGTQGAQDYWIVKTDASGNKQWDKRFGGSAGDYLNTIIRTSDGGYLLGGNSMSGISGDKTQASQGGQDYWVVKITSTGTKQWDKRFGVVAMMTCVLCINCRQENIF
ncbi:M6 family metalloprotease domain-containing protein [Rhodocytophaga rosea]|uniref:M6 family metalloprotease domain-containing protein n=2 Tax=Rhodocytophaga rosea TaxID=2704465 RepID=A0A6C0GQB1_9BACT|nr:M6 family metalloprotease domain-containing protein [Rhodocytophaga rosea]QHT70249.1 M6 family metalloprotease domain-containing protein [Rhodocytophaga rosea]